MRRALPLLLLFALAAPGPAVASWGGSTGGAAFSGAISLPQGAAPSVTVSGRNVSVSWSQILAGGAPVPGYSVRRYDTNGTQQAIGAGCATVQTGTACTENDLPPGSWVYRVAAVNGNWTGPLSSASSAANVAAPQLSISSPSTLGALPATLAGNVSSFLQSETVSFRLDNSSSGLSLSGSITPSPTPANGQAAVSVTIPAGVANGAHTVYAIGSGGDVASAPIVVAVPTAITTTAWNLRDASSGTESDQSDATAFADGRLRNTSALTTSFSAGRYLQLDYAPSLDAGASVSGAGFDFRFAENTAGRTACFYFEVRRTSTGAVLGTHGSTSSPVACTMTTTQQTFSTATPEVTTAAIANDISVRVYLRESGSGVVRIDMGTLTGTTPQPLSFTLYEGSLVDSTSGTASTIRWPLLAADSTVYTSSANWAGSFAASRYLKLSFPAYVPSGSTVSGASFRHSYRSNTTGTTCWYLELYSSTTLIGTHGSSASPISCNSSTTSFVTDTVALPELTNATQADNAIARVYVRNSSSLRSRDDLDTLSLSYLAP